MSLQATLETLERYTAAWTKEVITHEYNVWALPPQTDPTPGLDRLPLDDVLPGIYRQPFLYRLSFLRQLSTVAVTTHLDATHTRFVHSIGATKVAIELLDTLVNKPTLTGEALERDPILEKACIFYCFIHDAFHGPLGHSLDLMKDVFRIGMSHKIDVGSLSRALVEIEQNTRALAGPERQLLLAAEACMPGKGVELIKGVRLLSDPAALRRNRPEMYFLRDIVDSELDADRIDYLMRDGRVLDQWDGGGRLLKAVHRARTALISEDGRKVRRLVYDAEDQGTIAEAIGKRRKLYAEHYECAEKLVVDDMMCHGVYYVLRDLGATAETGSTADGKLRANILRNVLLLTDDDLLPALRDLQAPEAAYSLFERVRQHNYYVRISQVVISHSRADELKELHKEWQAAISELTEALRKERGGHKYDDVKQPEDRRLILQASERYLKDHELLVFSYQFHLHGSFLGKIEVEARMWRKLLQVPRAHERFDHFLSLEHGRGAVDKENVQKYLEWYGSYPPLHLTSSSYFNITGGRDVERHSKEGPDSKAFLYRREEGGKLKIENTPVPTDIARDYASYPLVFSAPATLVKAFGNDPLKKLLADELESLEWRPTVPSGS